MTAGFDFYEGGVSEGTTPKITVRKGGQLVLTAQVCDLRLLQGSHQFGLVLAVVAVTRACASVKGSSDRIGTGAHVQDRS